jgi:CysZ protein
MDLVKGLLYNLRGLRFAMKNGSLLLWGLIRFALVLVIMSLLAGLILAYHQGILDLIWGKPESPWILWLWHLTSWMLSLFLVGISAVFSYLISQILFSVLIMDYMSRITERKVTGRVEQPDGVPLLKTFVHLIRQEIPRAILPVLIALLIMVLSWLVVFLGPVMVVVSSFLTVIFLSWDNTDLTPARRLVPFRERRRFLLKGLLFHLGFGLPFLIPGLNLLFLSYAPVGATLYYLDRQDREKGARNDPKGRTPSTIDRTGKGVRGP